MSTLKKGVAALAVVFAVVHGEPAKAESAGAHFHSVDVPGSNLNTKMYLLRLQQEQARRKEEQKRRDDGFYKAPTTNIGTYDGSNKTHIGNADTVYTAGSGPSVTNAWGNQQSIIQECVGGADCVADIDGKVSGSEVGAKTNLQGNNIGSDGRSYGQYGTQPK